MLSRMMLTNANVLVMDEPTNHLDLESITALNNGLIKFPESMLFSSHDYEFLNTIANRIIEFGDTGYIDRPVKLEEYLEDPKIKEQRREIYSGSKALRL
jgi:ATPase subunit of ABC transporter with duplicated ATPase domains